MADNLEITEGVGTTVATDDISGVNYQRVKLVDGTLDSTEAIPGTAANGLDVDVTRLPALVAGSANIGDVDVLTIAAGETHIGEVGLADDTVTITCTLDTNAYASGDVLFDTQEIAGAVRVNGDTCILQSVHVLDKADQGINFELLFLKAATSIGTENAAISISAANAENIIGHYAFSNGWIDLINSQVLTDSGIGLVLEAGAATTSLYVAGISKGAGTYGASDILITFGFLRN